MAHRNSDIDIEKLLELATKPKVRKVKELKPNPEIDKFILECNIETGKKKVSADIVYYRYYLYKNIRLIDRRKFFKYFSTKFQKARTNKDVTYLLNPKGFDLTPQGHFSARAFLRQEREEKENNKK